MKKLALMTVILGFCLTAAAQVEETDNLYTRTAPAFHHVRGNGSTDPNAYTYTLEVYPGDNEHLFTGRRTYFDLYRGEFVTSYAHVDSLLRDSAYRERTLGHRVFKHTFPNYDEFITALPKVLDKLYERLEDDEIRRYKVFVTVNGMVNGKYPEYFEENYHVYKSKFKDINDGRVRNIVEQYENIIIRTALMNGDPDNMIHLTNKIFNLNYVYIDRNLVEYTWDSKAHKLVKIGSEELNFDEI